MALASLERRRRGILKPMVIAMVTRMNVLADGRGAEGQYQHTWEAQVWFRQGW